MRITRNQLRQLIQEELGRTLEEASPIVHAPVYPLNPENPMGEQILTATVAGIVDKIYAREGDRFSAGQVLISLGPDRQVIAPEDGVVTDVGVSLGQRVMQHDTLLNVFLAP
tara:strand:+ start:40 stop:375 length:336 start_codon:yes stop_codon:yes gene_type:complete